MWSVLVTPLASRTEKWWGSVMDVGLDPELTKWSVRSGLAIVLTGKGYKEHHWLAIPSINHFGYPHFLSTTTYSTMPMSARTIPRTQDQYGRGRAAVRVRGQTGNRTNVGRAITPFMFNEEGYRVSSHESIITRVLTWFQYAHDEEGREYPPANDFYRRSNTHDPDQDGFEDLYRRDFIHAISCVAHRKLSRHHLDPYQRAAFRRGIIRYNTGKEE